MRSSPKYFLLGSINSNLLREPFQNLLAAGPVMLLSSGPTARVCNGLPPIPIVVPSA